MYLLIVLSRRHRTSHFDFNGLANTVNPEMCLVIFIFITIIVNVTGLNALIAILGESYGKVMEHQSV